MARPIGDPESHGASVELARIRSHELHIRYIYGLRIAGLAFAAIALIIGAWMTFRGLQGSFNWAIEAPHSIGARMTNASPGIVFATIGLILGIVILKLPPVNYIMGSEDSPEYMGIEDPGVYPRGRRSRK
jgi:hypothetical protein